ncbi:MAG: sporulation protein YabP [Clostridiales bacterium]|nr:sporulation protein YabP [Clostridiales bacterium]MCD8216204.1 sporulation protein YabP [Clostridiales bacterium]
MAEENRLLKNVIRLENRERLSVTGVLDVVRFDEFEILCECEKGVLAIKGDNLHITKIELEKGDLLVDGAVTSLVYEDKSVKGSFLKSLFK